MTPLYAAQQAPRRLTDEELVKIVRQLGWGDNDFDVAEIVEVARAIEARILGEQT